MKTKSGVDGRNLERRALVAQVVGQDGDPARGRDAAVDESLDPTDVLDEVVAADVMGSAVREIEDLAIVDGFKPARQVLQLDRHALIGEAHEDVEPLSAGRT